MLPPSDPATRPVRIAREPAERRVRIVWADGHECLYDWEYLRRNCLCAYCHGEWGAPGAMSSNPPLSPAQTELTSMAHVGRYAISLTWADGHDTGIYSFRDLRAMCPEGGQAGG